jgi:hypothetical protein
MRTPLMDMPPALRISVRLLLYASELAASLWLAYELRFDFTVGPVSAQERLVVLLWLVPLQLVLLALFLQLSPLLGYFSTPDLARMFYSLVISAAMAMGAWLALGAGYAPPRSVILIDLVFSLVGLTGARLALRTLRETLASSAKAASGPRHRVAIIGAGDAGAVLAHELFLKPGYGLNPVAFFDDDSHKWSSRVHGIRVLGPPEQITREAPRLNIQEAIIAMPSGPAKRVGEIVHILRKSGLPCRTVPSLEQLANGQVRVSQLRNVQVQDLLGCERVELETETIRQFLRGRVVLVTGAGGSIGGELAADSLHRGEAENALAFSKELLQQTNALFSDRLLRLDVLHATLSRDFEVAAASAQKEAAGDLRKLFEFVTWEETRAGPAGALAWLQSLPAETQTNQPVALLAADCQAALKQWQPLEVSLERQQWGGLDFVRYAFKSLALRGQELTSSSGIAWARAFNATGGRKESLVMLLRLAAAWNWVTETEDLLWTIIHKFPAEKWAVVALSRNLLWEGQTRALMALYGEQTKMNPSDLSARNNLTMTALLLDARELRPHDLAREIFRKAPTNPAYASTYAYSLHLQRRSAQALRVFDRLKPDQLEQASVALYYAIVLQTTGNGERARKYLDIAAGIKLLPEERKLLIQARAKA